MRLSVVGADQAARETDRMSRAFRDAENARSRFGRSSGELDGDGGGGGGGGREGRSYTDRVLARFTRVTFTLALIERSAEGLSKGLDQVARRITQPGEALATTFRSMAESLPFFGGFVRALETAGNALTGATSRRAFALENLQQATGAIGTFGNIQGVRQNTEFQIQALRRQQAEAQIGVGGARAFLGGLTPQALNYFNPPVDFGVANAGTGPARLAEAMAQSEVREAQRIVASRQGDVTAARGRADFFNPRIAGLAGEADIATAGVQGLERLRRGLTAPFGRVANEPTRRDVDAAIVEARVNQENKINQLGEVRKQQGKELTNLLERQKDLQAAQTTLAQKEAEAREKTVGKLRNQLSLLDERITSAKGGATAAGRATEGDLAGAEDALRRLKQFGYGALSPEEQANIAHFAPQFEQQEAEKFGRTRPAFQRFQQATDLTGDALPELERQRQELANEITRLMAENNLKLKQGIADSLGPALQDMITTLLRAMENEIKRQVEELIRTRGKQELQGQQAQAG